MRGKPRTLQGRHKRLIVNFRLQDVDTNKYYRQDGAKAQYPFVSPPDIGNQPGQWQEERIPQTSFSHGSERRTFQRKPQQPDEGSKHHQPGCRQCTSLHMLSLEGSPRADYPEQDRYDCKIDKIVPAYHNSSFFVF